MAEPFDSSRPIYAQLVERLKAKILSKNKGRSLWGKLLPGSNLILFLMTYAAALALPASASALSAPASPEAASFPEAASASTL